MPHVRTQIRTAVAAALAGLPTTGSRVEIGRVRPLPAGHAPTLLVYTTTEDIEARTIGRPVLLDRRMSLVIDGRVYGAGEPDETLDKIELEVDAIMGVACEPSGCLVDLVTDCQIVRVTQAAAADGEAVRGAVRLEYRVEYSTYDGAPGAAA